MTNTAEKLTLPLFMVKYNGDLLISTGRSRFETSWKNKTMSWAALLNKLSRSMETTETHAEYMKMSKEQQDKIKDIGGFVGGHLRDGRRKTGYVTARQLLTLDLDFPPAEFGDTIPEADFSKVEAKAEAVIGYLTYINGDIFAKEDNRVKLAVCAAAEVVHYHNNQASANGNQAAGVKSETNDGYSVTYITEGQDGQTAEELLRKKILEAARVYLLPTGWLSRSLKGGCRHVCADCDNSL